MSIILLFHSVFSNDYIPKSYTIYIKYKDIFIHFLFLNKFWDYVTVLINVLTWNYTCLILNYFKNVSIYNVLSQENKEKVLTNQMGLIECTNIFFFKLDYVHMTKTRDINKKDC